MKYVYPSPSGEGLGLAVRLWKFLFKHLLNRDLLLLDSQIIQKVHWLQRRHSMSWWLGSVL